MSTKLRLFLIALVAILNLGLGFAAAIYAGRGPRSRFARWRIGAKPVKKSPEVPLENPQRTEISVDHLEKELDEVERRFQKLFEQPAGESSPNTASELLSALRMTLEQFAPIAPESSLPPDARQRIEKGIETLRHTLKTACTELQSAMENASPTSPDPVSLAANLMTTCREVRVMFTAHRFLDQSA